MLSIFQAITLGLLQGFSELFPISSLGHSVILPKLLSWDINQSSNYFLIFLVTTHLATALVLLWFFRNDWIRILKGFFRSLKAREIGDSDARLAWLLVFGTIPAGILGLLLEQYLKTLFASAQFASFFLLLNGVLLYGAELLRRRRSDQTEAGDSDQRIAKLAWPKAIQVGLMQSIGLIPGFSRTGSAIAGGLLVGLSHQDAARFSFLLATPIIGAAAVLKIPQLTGSSSYDIEMALIGAFFSAVAAYFSVRFLTKYFKTNSLRPFAIYCFTAGLLLSVYFLWRG